MTSTFLRAIKAETLKTRRTSVRKTTLIMPLVCIALAIAMLLFSGSISAGVWNWWYSMLLPGMIVIVCSSIANADARLKLQPVLGLSAPLRATWAGKIAYCLFLVFAANLVICFGIVLASLVFGLAFDLQANLLAALLLTLANAWLVPLSLALTTRFGTLTGIFAPLLVQLIGGFAMWTTPVWWLCPPSTTLCLMSPVLGILPNGLPLPDGSPLGTFSTESALGLGLSLAVFAAIALITTRWFARQEAR